MGFWHKVVDELEYQGKSRKQLAMEAGFDVSTIGTGLKRNGMPQADLALRIAKALNVPIEYLVDDKANDVTKATKKTTINEWIELVAKYKKMLDSLETMPEKTRQAIVRMIEEIG